MSADTPNEQNSKNPPARAAEPATGQKAARPRAASGTKTRTATAAKPRRAPAAKPKPAGTAAAGPKPTAFPRRRVWPD